MLVSLIITLVKATNIENTSVGKMSGQYESYTIWIPTGLIALILISLCKCICYCLDMACSCCCKSEEQDRESAYKPENDPYSPEFQSVPAVDPSNPSTENPNPNPDPDQNFVPPPPDYWEAIEDETKNPEKTETFDSKQ